MNQQKYHLRNAFPPIPPGCYNALMHTAGSVQETQTNQHRHKRLLIAAACLVVVMAAGYAAFSSQVVEFFGKQYGKESQEWLRAGAADANRTSFTADGITFTLNEVVYRNKGLYGLIAISGKGAQDAAVYVAKIGVDDGLLAAPASVGYASEKASDDSILYAFEVADGLAIAEGSLYAIQFTPYIHGKTYDWQVKVQPQWPQQAAESQATAAPAAPAPDTGEVQIIVPEQYNKHGTMPVYKAAPRDFGAVLQPEWFNTSGIAKKGQSCIVFNDEAELSWAPEAFFYNEYNGTYNGNYKEPDAAPMMIPLPSLSNAAARLALDAYRGWPASAKWQDISQDKLELAGLTVEAAKQQAEVLLKKLQVEGYSCDWYMKMDVQRIKTMGEHMNQLLSQNKYWNSPILDYSKVAAENEGILLHYQNGCKTAENLFDIHVYVNRKGIAHMQVRDLCARGEIYSTPVKLVDAQSVMDQLPAEIAKSRFSDMKAQRIKSVELTYAPARAANKADGMVMTPAWYVTYTDTNQGEYDAFAVFNAVDGKLLNASFL